MEKSSRAINGLVNERQMEQYALLEFCVLTFAITWGLVFLFFRFPFHFLLRFGPLELDKLFYRLYWHVCVYAPAISAFAVIARRCGLTGVRAYVRRVLQWKIGVKWYIMVLIGFPAFYAIDRGIFIGLGGSSPPNPFHTWYLILPSAMLSVFTNPGPVEELGWRGFALPLLQRRFSALAASMILGTIWGFWHLPAFFLHGPPYTLAVFPAYFLQAISLAIIMTALYNATSGNILLAFLFHWQFHDPFNIDVFPKDLYIVTPMLMIVALALILILGSRKLGHEKCTELLR